MGSRQEATSRSMIRVREADDPEVWNRKIRRCPEASATHLFGYGERHLLIEVHDEEYAFPFIERRILGARVAASYGRRADGGLVPLSGRTRLLPHALRALASALRDEGYDALCMALRLDTPYRRRLRRALLACGGIEEPRLARVLDISGGFDRLWTQAMNKKARNAVRKFLRHGGCVEIINPEEHLDELVEIGRSSPLRQGRPMPPSYTDPEELRKVIRRALSIFGDNMLAYGALIQGKIVGYAFIVHLNGYAYVSRFLIHMGYRSLCVGESLLAGILKDLQQRGIRMVQYGYWSRAHPGINHFLKQFGFRGLPVANIYVPLTSRGALLCAALRLKRLASENLRRGAPGLWNLVTKMARMAR